MNAPCKRVHLLDRGPDNFVSRERGIITESTTGPFHVYNYNMTGKKLWLSLFARYHSSVAALCKRQSMGPMLQEGTITIKHHMLEGT